MEEKFPEIATWPLAVVIRGEFSRVDLTGEAFQTQRKLGALQSAWGEVSDLSVIVCKCCNGFGHS